MQCLFQVFLIHIPHAEHLVNLLMKSQLPRSIKISSWVTWTFSLVILGRGSVRNSSGTLTFFILSRFLGRNSSQISLSGWHLVIFRAEQSKKAPCRIGQGQSWGLGVLFISHALDQSYRVLFLTVPPLKWLSASPIGKSQNCSSPKNE